MIAPVKEEEFRRIKGITLHRIKQLLPKEKLEELYLKKGFSTRKIAKMFGVTHRTICLLLDEYGIPRVVGRGKKWTEEEVRILLEYYPKGRIDKIIELTGRTEKAIIGKALRLGLKRQVPEFPDISKLDKIDVAYLAGLIDGDGTITLRGEGKGYYYSPEIVISNTDMGIINKVIKILEKTNVKYYVQDVFTKGWNKKPLKRISIVGIENVYPLLKALTPYLASKKKKVAKLVMKWCEIRLFKQYMRPPIERVYAEEELEIVKEVKRLNDRGAKSS